MAPKKGRREDCTPKKGALCAFPGASSNLSSSWHMTYTCHAHVYLHNAQLCRHGVLKAVVTSCKPEILVCKDLCVTLGVFEPQLPG